MFSKHAERSVEHLLTLRVVSATFRFWSVLSFSGAFLMMFFAFFYSDKHPIFFFINASANQSLNRQDCRPSNKLTRYTNVLAPILIMISLEVKSKRSMDSQARQVLWKRSLFFILEFVLQISGADSKAMEKSLKRKGKQLIFWFFRFRKNF